ncbi:MAG: metal ABC transporter permease [Clostridium sp.]|nr:metal ABC transporter permease [Clostridium sp.]
MSEFLSALKDYPFLLRAMTAGVCVAVCAALLGVNLVLKRYSMIGDGLSHTAFGALAVSSALGLAPLWAAIPITVLAAILLLRFGGKGKLGGDSAVALLSVSALAAGVLVLSLKGANADLNSYLFGSLLALSRQDTILSEGLAVLVLLLYAIFYHQLFAVSFDEPFARAAGLPAGLSGAVLAALTAAVVVLGMRLMGALLISALILFPPLAAMRSFGSYRAVTLGAVAFALLGFGAGLAASWFLGTPAGASIVMCNLAVYLVCWGTAKLRAALPRRSE